jgi:hypothetical protein
MLTPCAGPDLFGREAPKVATPRLAFVRTLWFGFRGISRPQVSAVAVSPLIWSFDFCRAPGHRRDTNPSANRGAKTAGQCVSQNPPKRVVVYADSRHLYFSNSPTPAPH